MWSVYQVGIAYYEITSQWYTVNKTLKDIVYLNGQNNLLNSISFGSIICHSLSAENYFSFIKHSFWGPFDSAALGDHASHPSPVVVSVSIAKNIVVSTEVRSGQVIIVCTHVCLRACDKRSGEPRRRVVCGHVRKCMGFYSTEGWSASRSTVFIGTVERKPLNCSNPFPPPRSPLNSVLIRM
jgi:hypothetical protein